MINLSAGCKKLQISQTTKAQDSQAKKAMRHEMHMSMLGLKHLKQVSDEK